LRKDPEAEGRGASEGRSLKWNQYGDNERIEEGQTMKLSSHGTRDVVGSTRKVGQTTLVKNVVTGGPAGKDDEETCGGMMGAR